MAHLEIRDIEVSFDGFKAVDGFSLDVKKGELRCLLGANGAGKSTTLDLICGKTTPTSGTVCFNGQVINRLSEYERARLGIGRKFQVPSIFRELTVLQNLEIARSHAPGWISTMCVFGVRRDKRLREVVDLVGLGDRLLVRAEHLSHGETQWLEIAMLLMQESELILMDEPSAGMTIQETSTTAHLFNELRGHHTLIVVEHDMSFVREIAETVTVMHGGKLLAEGTIDEMEHNERVKEAYLGKGGTQHA